MTSHNFPRFSFLDNSLEFNMYFPLLKSKLKISSTKIKTIQTDGAGEFVNKHFIELCLSSGIQRTSASMPILWKQL